MPGIGSRTNGKVVAVGAGGILGVCQEVKGARAAVVMGVRAVGVGGAGAVDQGRALRGAVIGAHGGQAMSTRILYVPGSFYSELAIWHSIKRVWRAVRFILFNRLGLLWCCCSSLVASGS